MDRARSPQPLRSWLLRLGPRDAEGVACHVLLLLLHHIAGDGGSMAPLWRDLAGPRAICTEVDRGFIEVAAVDDRRPEHGVAVELQLHADPLPRRFLGRGRLLHRDPSQPHDEAIRP